MRIAMVSEPASPLAVNGGTDEDAHVAGLSAALARRGHSVTVYTRRDDPALPDQVDTSQGYRVVRVSAGPAEPLPVDELLTHMGQFAQFLNEHWVADRPDVVHAHFWVSGIAAQLAARHRDLPTVQTFHSLGVSCAKDASPPARQRLEALLARTATWVLATCTEEGFELVRMGRSRDRISVVPCGVDVDLFTPVGPTAPPSQRHRIVSVGRLLPHKGFDTIIRALPSIPGSELVLIGGPQRSELELDAEARRLRRIAEGVRVSDRVIMSGSIARADMPTQLRSADVVACTPCDGPFGIVALEAMACGVPVVASAVGGIRDTVVHDVTGYLVPPKRPAALAAAINTLNHDEFLRHSFGAAGRDRARSRYSWDRIAADTQRAYDRVAAHPCRRVTLAATFSSG